MFKGYVISKGKTPKESFKNGEPLYDLETMQKNTLFDYGGVLEDHLVMVDVDDKIEAELVLKIVQAKKLQCSILKTTRGYHFYFLNNGIDKNSVGRSTPIDVKVDIKLGTRNTVVPLRINGEMREWLQEVETFDLIPEWLKPIRSIVGLRGMSDGDGRNQKLFNYILQLQNNGFRIDAIRDIIGIVNEFIFNEPLNPRELEVILRDEAFLKPQFFDKQKFMHANFSEFLMNEEHVIKLNGLLHNYVDGIYVAEGIEHKMIQHIKDLTDKQRKETLSYLKVMIPNNSPVAPATLIGLKNGILDIETMTMREFHPDIILQNKINYTYNSNAYHKLTDLTLDKLAVGCKDTRKLLEEMVGYCLYRRNELRKCFILTGDGQNGKSTFLKMIDKLFEGNTCNLSLTDVTEHKFMAADLLNKLVNIGPDIKKAHINDTTRFKNVVSGDAIIVERKNQHPFKLENYAKLLFGANKMPTMVDKGDEIMSRLVEIPFTAKFTKRDPDFDPEINDKLTTTEALEYLLKIAIEGLKRVLRNKDFTIPKKVSDRALEYEKENNQVVEFVEDYYPIDAIIGKPTKDIYLIYQTWSLEAGHKNPLCRQTFTSEICRRYKLYSKLIREGNLRYRIYELL